MSEAETERDEIRKELRKLEHFPNTKYADPHEEEDALAAIMVLTVHVHERLENALAKARQAKDHISAAASAAKCYDAVWPKLEEAEESFADASDVLDAALDQMSRPPTMENFEHILWFLDDSWDRYKKDLTHLKKAISSIK